MAFEVLLLVPCHIVEGDTGLERESGHRNASLPHLSLPQRLVGEEKASV